MNMPILCAQAPYGQDCCCCQRCSVGGCDLKVIPCGCCLHVRCCPVSETQLLQTCPVCHQSSTGLHLIPIAFDEIDQATAEAAQTSITTKRGKKRQNATVARLNPALQQQAKSSSASATSDDAASSTVAESSELRTGRWTVEETAYCDKLIFHFEQGSLPIPEKMKLNDFLSNMLKSKQSRLTKKMKNAKLSAKQYKRKIGFIMGDTEARQFSQLETDLFGSMKCRMERAELRFHMQKVWRELFSGFCISIGQKLELDAWLRSVEEMERRTSQAMDAARKARRKAMIGYALNEDTQNVQTGVMIDPHVFVDRSSQVVIDQNGEFAEMGSETDSLVGNSSLSNKRPRTGALSSGVGSRPKPKSSSFVARVMLYVQQRQIPFEHVDVWAPCFGNNVDFVSGNQERNRLTFAGCATAETKTQSNDSRVVPLSSKEQYDLLAFGEYSQRFSFQIGSGLPGRVFSSGVASWEQGIKSAPQSLFERGGGARQWGVETALGVPVTSPNVGRVVVVFYSVHDRPRDEQLVGRMTEELARLMPVPRWKLVVDVGADTPGLDNVLVSNDARESDLRNLLQGILAGNNVNPSIPQSMTGLIPLSQILLKTDRNPLEQDLLQHSLNSYETYKRQGRADTEVAWMTCRDFIMKEPEMRKQHQQFTVGAPQAQVGTAMFPTTAPGPQPMVNNASSQATSSCCPPSAANIATPSSAGCTSQNPSNCCPPQEPNSAANQRCCPPPSSTTTSATPSTNSSTTNGCCPPPQPRNPNSTQQTPAIANTNRNTSSHALPSTNGTTIGSSAASTDHLVLPGSNVLDNFINAASELDGHPSELGMAGNMDLGVSASQLAQLLQSESAGFHM